LQQERKSFGFRPVAKSALAGLLVVLLLLAAILSANPFHRQLFHAGAAGDNHLCVICLFASGQVNAADLAPILTGFVSSFVGFDFPATRIVFAATDYRLSPSRAPPSVSSSSTVVG
jgi:hypothetical protein